MSRYRLRPKALEDLAVIGEFIARDNAARAASFIDELLELCTRIAEHPQSFQRRDDLAKGLRQAVHGRYLILFTTEHDDVVIERVLHGARRLEDLL